MDFDHIDDAELDRLVDAARSGDGPLWLHELHAELALGPVDPQVRAGVVAAAAAEARAVHEQPAARSNVRSILSKRRTKVAAVVGVAVALQLSPLAAAQELRQHLTDPGKVVSSIRSAFGGSSSTDDSADPSDDTVELVEPVAPTSTSRPHPSTTATTVVSEPDEVIVDEPEVEQPEYLDDQLPLTEVEDDHALPDAPPPQGCDTAGTDPADGEQPAEGDDAATVAAEGDPCDEGAGTDPDPSTDPGTGDDDDGGDGDGEVVLPPPPPPPPPSSTSTTTTTAPGGSRPSP